MSDLSSTTTIYETVYGSRAFGLATAESDEDIRGVLVGPKAWYFGFRPAPEQITLHKEHVLYEVRKLFKLGEAANPTVIEMLWVDPRFHRIVRTAGERLLAARDLFLTRRVKDTFGGYAHSQLKRIKTHRRWLLSPPSEKPTRAQFGLPERTVIPRDQWGALEALIADGKVDQAELTPNFLKALDRERSYRAAQREWRQFCEWRKTRNPVRAELERRYGYDTKHAQHLLRLLRMGVEILEQQRVIVERPDRDELLAIRNGAWSYEQLLAESEGLHGRLQEAAEDSALPEVPDQDALEETCQTLIEGVLRSH